VETEKVRAGVIAASYEPPDTFQRAMLCYFTTVPVPSTEALLISKTTTDTFGDAISMPAYNGV